MTIDTKHLTLPGVDFYLGDLGEDIDRWIANPYWSACPDADLETLALVARGLLLDRERLERELGDARAAVDAVREEVDAS